MGKGLPWDPARRRGPGPARRLRAGSQGWPLPMAVPPSRRAAAAWYFVYFLYIFVYILIYFVIFFAPSGVVSDLDYTMPYVDVGCPDLL